MTLRVTVGDATFEAEWTGDDPAMREAIEAELPISRTAHRWGDELYAPVPIDVEPGATQQEVPEGAIAYWPDGPALCLFWGPTPASQADEPRAASPVAVVARVESPERLDGMDPDTGVLLRFDQE